jgi:hypothetical protein
MDEVKVLLDAWKEDGLVNPGSLESAYNAIVLLVAKVEELEAQVQALSK